MNDRPTPELSPRERQLIDFAAQGLTDTAIALKLGISEATVGTYWGRVRIKLGPYSRTELVAIVMKAKNEEALETLRTENEKVVKQLQTQAELEKSFYQNLLMNAPDAMVLVDESGLIEYANFAAYALFGYKEGELEGCEIAILVPPRFREIHKQHRQEFLESPTRKQMGDHLETPAFRKDGTEFLIRAALSAIKTERGYVAICAVRPV